ncbi:hypothetical protein ACUN7V_10625 [Quadrisphaera oryzae]|uniref:hypothetical protein n=1 Tax=Quadrisphaera TaxID=317661 RepID=UPI0016453632|nr:hypothetical protein [Quadrisphaera sp. RL12-1S]MBC3762277.1 hypothetical protein [Quadrisphaera sp. RL12-1S]
MTHSDHGRLVGAARAVLEHLPGRSSGSGTAVQQTVTMTAPAVDVLTALEDPAVLSHLLGDLGSVEPREGGQRWRFAAGEGHDGLVWDTALARRADGLRYEGTGGSTGSLDVTTSPAPRDHGLEVRLVLDLSLPRLAAGAAAFTLLYRLRALLVSGEVPTLRPQPSARDERG